MKLTSQHKRWIISGLNQLAADVSDGFTDSAGFPDCSQQERETLEAEITDLINNLAEEWNIDPDESC